MTTTTNEKEEGHVAAGDGEALADPLVGVKALTGRYLGMNRRSCHRRRIKGCLHRKSNVYHVMSRTCGGTVFFDETEKEALLLVMRKLARFCGIKILTFCIMGNHFHALVRVPNQAAWLEERFGVPGASGEGKEGEGRLLNHLRTLYSKVHVGALKSEWNRMRKEGNASAVEERIGALTARMCDVSKWMEEVKVRFSRWYNRRHGRMGTLWMGPFKSVLVEAGSRGQSARSGAVDERGPDVVQVMAAYIDLNPVRAGLVDGAEDYRWSGWRAALDGDKEAIAGLCDVVGCAVKDWPTRGKDAYSGMVAERRKTDGPTERVRELDEAKRRTLLVKIPEFSRSLVIGEVGNDDGDAGMGRSRRARVGFVHGLTLRMIVGNGPRGAD